MEETMHYLTAGLLNLFEKINWLEIGNWEH